MAEIRIRRKHHTRWWPLLLVLLVPLAWYLFQVRSRVAGSSDLARDTGSIPPAVPLPPIARTPVVEPAAATSAPVTTTKPASTPTRAHAPAHGKVPAAAPRTGAPARP